MRETQEVILFVNPKIRMPVYKGYYGSDLECAYYEPDRNRFEYCGDEVFPAYWLEKQSRIVLTPEEYREDMVPFANFIRTNSYHVLNDNYQMYDGSGVFTISELFDIYQTIEMSDNEINEDKITETELTTDEIWEKAKGYTHSATALESAVWAQKLTNSYWKQRLIEEVEKARHEGYAAGFDAGYGEGVNVI